MLLRLMSLAKVFIKITALLNNIVEQSHRFIKQKMVQALGWKSKVGAEATMSGQETWSMIKRGQVGDTSMPAWERFYALAA